MPQHSDWLSLGWKIFQYFALKTRRDVNISLEMMCIICRNQQNTPVDESNVTFSLCFTMTGEKDPHTYSSSLMQQNHTDPIRVVSYTRSQNRVYIRSRTACGPRIEFLPLRLNLGEHDTICVPCPFYMRTRRVFADVLSTV